MQTFLLPAARSGSAPPPFTLSKPSLPNLRRPLPFINSPSASTHQSLSFTSSFLYSQQLNRNLIIKNPNNNLASAPISVAYNEYPEQAKLAQVAKRLDSTSRYFKRLGSLGFWGQLVSTIVAAVILSFSVVITGKVTSPATFYATAGGIVAAFISVFMSFGYIRLSDRLRKTVNNLEKASANTILSQILGLVFSLELLRSVTIPPSDGVPVARVA